MHLRYCIYFYVRNIQFVCKVRKCGESKILSYKEVITIEL